MRGYHNPINIGVILMIKKYIIAGVLSQICALTSVQAAPNSFPADMMYAGKPIDSLCFANNESNSQTIDLKNCDATTSKYTIKGQNALLSKKGYTGYIWQDPEFSPGPEGYSYYKFFPANDNKYWVYTINSGGGSGEFTAIYLVQRKDADTLTVKNIAGGDRCNSGIQDVTEKNHALTFSVNLTPYDFVTLTDKKLPNLKAYDDLAACAACCFGKAFYTITESNLNPPLNHVDLGKIITSEIPDQGKYAACFNKLFAPYNGKDKVIFTQEKINAFADQFKQACMQENTKTI